MKNFLRLVVPVFVFALFLNFPVAADTETLFQFNENTGTIVRYIGADSEVIIPITINDVAVRAIGFEAFRNLTNVTSVTIPYGVTSIGSSAFSGCQNLKNIIIPDSVTSIGSLAFSGCSSLTNVVIPDSVTSMGSSIFFHCTNLESVTLPKDITIIGNEMFFACSSLTSIIIPDGVISIGSNAFQGCTGLTSIMIPDSVTHIHHAAFSDCTNLTSVTLSNRLISIGTGAFSNCTSLTSITIPAGVTSILGDNLWRGAFSGCTGLYNVYFESATPPPITGFNAFSNVAYGARAIVPAGATAYGQPGSLWNGLIVTPLGFGQVPETGIANITGAAALMLVLIFVSAVLLVYLLRSKLSRAGTK